MADRSREEWLEFFLEIREKLATDEHWIAWRDYVYEEITNG
jgi:hypothetical protein